MTNQKTTPELVKLLEKRLYDKNELGAIRITKILFERDGRSRKRCYNTLLSYAALKTNPQDELVKTILLLQEYCDEYLALVSKLINARNCTCVENLLKEKPSELPENKLQQEYFEYVRKLSTGQELNLSELVSVFLAIHRSKSSIKQNAGYRRFSFLCVFAFAHFEHAEETHAYIKLLFDFILSEKNWRWKAKSEKLYISFFVWLYERHHGKQ